MERSYWPAWERSLRQSGWIPTVRDLLGNARSVLLLFSQVMVLGAPFCQNLSWGRETLALVEMLGDDEKLDAFSDFLTEVGA